MAIRNRYNTFIDNGKHLFELIEQLCSAMDSSKKNLLFNFFRKLNSCSLPVRNIFQMYFIREHPTKCYNYFMLSKIKLWFHGNVRCIRFVFAFMIQHLELHTFFSIANSKIYNYSYKSQHELKTNEYIECHK